MKRSAILRKPDDKARAIVKQRRAKCKVCRFEFLSFSSLQNWCSPECGATLAKAKLANIKASEAKLERAQDRAALERIKTLPMLKAEAQKSFNAFIRLRDAGRPCICCGRQPTSEALTGGGFDAGHYRSVGSAPHLRFDERNCHAQLKQCNRHGAGRAVDYRIGLIERIGLETVEALESAQATKHYTRDDLRAIRTEYRAKAAALRKVGSA